MAIARPEKKVQPFVEELQGLILKAFPEARFRVAPMPEGEGTAIWTYTNAQSFWDVADLVRDREFEIMMDKGVFLYVIPMPLETVEQ